MDITQKRQVSEDQRIFIDAVKWDQATPAELLGTGSQQAQLYPSDIDLFSAVKNVSVKDPAEMYRHMQSVFRRAQDAGDMFFIEFKLQNVDGTKQKWYDTDFDEGEFIAAAGVVDFLKVDYVIFIRGINLFTELSSIYSFSPMPAVRTLTTKIGYDFAHYYKEGKVYKSLKRMYSIYKLQGKKEKLVQLSKLFNSGTGFKYSLSSNLKAIELLLEHVDDYSIQNLVKVNLKNLENIIGVKIRSSKQMQVVIQALDAQIEKETQEFLRSGNTSLVDKTHLKGNGFFDDLLAPTYSADSGRTDWSGRKKKKTLFDKVSDYAGSALDKASGLIGPAGKLLKDSGQALIHSPAAMGQLKEILHSDDAKNFLAGKFK